MSRIARRRQRNAGLRTGHLQLAFGCGAAALYVMVVAWAWPYPVRLLYDGLAPLPPYRWVHPPADRRDNAPALPGAGTLVLGPQGSRPGEIATDDDQALVTFPEAAIASRTGESSVKVVITPLDPAAGAPAPAGRHLDGNAYRIEASYAASATPAVLATPVTVVLRYPIHATQILRLVEAEWIALPTRRFDGSQQVLANSDRLGMFVAASGSQASAAPRGAYLAAGAGLVGASAGVLLTRRRTQRRRT